MRYASTLRALYAPYLATTGIWPLAHRQSFERVTGPKEDYWLVQTVGGLAIVIGSALGVAVPRRTNEPETIVLGAASCIAFGLASLRASQTESRVYLGDALLEIAFLAAWLEPVYKKIRGGGPPTAWPSGGQNSPSRTSWSDRLVAALRRNR